MSYGILEEEDVCLYLLYPCCYHHHLQRRVIPPPCCDEFRFHPHLAAGQPVVEPSKGLTDPGCHYPDLRSKQGGCLSNHLLKFSRCLGVGLLPPQNRRETCRLPPDLSHIIDYLQPVIVRRGQEHPQILKGDLILQDPPVFLKRRRHSCVSLPL